MSVHQILKILALPMVGALGACSGQPPAQEPPLAMKVTTVARSTMAADDGVPMAYELRGSGDITLVFVHCWACDRSFWREQLDVFDDDFQVVAMDLPGHGASGRREEGTILELGRDVAKLVQVLGLKRVIFIGHSMGGPVSLAAAGALPDVALGVIGLDTLHNAEAKPPAGMIETMSTAFQEDFEATMERFVRSAFPAEASPELVEEVVAKARQADPETATRLLQDFPTLDLPVLFREAGVPIRVINAAPRGGAGTVTEVEINRRFGDFEAEVVEGVGHFLHLENSLEINPRIRRFVGELAANR